MVYHVLYIVCFNTFSCYFKKVYNVKYVKRYPNLQKPMHLRLLRVGQFLLLLLLPCPLSLHLL